MNYATVTDGTSELVVMRSKFLGFCFKVESEEEVTTKLKELRKRFVGATHVCYAAIWDERGTLSRFSDDGEPSGTAGAPIMDAITGAGVVKCLVAVVRYFGGTKLGTGGLTRAYREAASSALSSARRITVTLCDVYQCKTDYSTFKRLSGFDFRNVSYGDGVSFEYYVPTGESVEPLVNKAGGKSQMIRSGTLYKELTD